MKPSDYTIYAVCIQNEKVRYEAQSKIVPIMGGAWNIVDAERRALREQGYVFAVSYTHLTLPTKRIV